MKTGMEYICRAMIVANTLYAKVAQGQSINVHVDRTGALTSTRDSVSTSPRNAFLALVGCTFVYYTSEVNYI